MAITSPIYDRSNNTALIVNILLCFSNLSIVNLSEGLFIQVTLLQRENQTVLIHIRRAGFGDHSPSWGGFFFFGLSLKNATMETMAAAKSQPAHRNMPPETKYKLPR